MTVLGCDVSVWDDDNSTPQQVDFKVMKSSGSKFVYIKSSQGLWMDQDMIYNWQNAKNEGVVRGAYHFLTWTDDPVRQADFFAGILTNDMGELPLCVDFEKYSVETPANAVKILWAFLVELEKKLGVIPMIYTGPYFWKEFGTSSSAWLKYRLWIAHYGVKSPMIPAPWSKFDFWQFTDRGDGKKFGCESKDLDMNVYSGSEDEFNKEFNIVHSESTPVIVPEQKPITTNKLKYKNISGRNMNIRKMPSTGSEIIGCLLDGDIVEAADFIGNDCWANIDTDKWVCVKQGDKKYLELQEGE